MQFGTRSLHATAVHVYACVLPVLVVVSALQGDPSAAPYAVENAKKVLGKKPVFGICMGHQILGQAFGGKTFKLKFGHHGGNHPIRFNPTGEDCAVICCTETAKSLFRSC